MARRKAPPEQENHERWLVSYADFITLLFAFFVVMYAVSSVNEGKYRVLSDSLAVGFKGPPKSLQPIQVGSLVRQRTLAEPLTTYRHKPPADVLKLPPGPVEQPLMPIPLPKPLHRTGVDRPEPEDPLDTMYKQVTKMGEDLIDNDMLQVRRADNWIELELRQSMLFAGANANMKTDGAPVLKKIADLLAPYPNSVHVEGHADSRPIKTSLFPSNWELSAARAASVVSYFVDQGIDAQRLAAVGYGQFRPIADNASEEGRQRNRRVVIVIHSEARAPRPFGESPTADAGF